MIVLESVNDIVFLYVIYLYGYYFCVLECNGKRFVNLDWCDIYMIVCGEIVKIVFVIDNFGKWLVYCYMFGYVILGMMDWFEVI